MQWWWGLSFFSPESQRMNNGWCGWEKIICMLFQVGMGGGMGLAFFGHAQNSTVEAEGEWCTSGITPIGWEGTTVGYLLPDGCGGPGHRALWMGRPGVMPIGWEGIIVVIRGH